MKFSKPTPRYSSPTVWPTTTPSARVTHLGIGAHQDDLEIMAFHGIQKCFTSKELWFGAVTSTDGAGSPRAGEYAAWSDADMAALRRREQEKAAVLGNYGALVQLNYTSAEVKDVGTGRLKADLVKILKLCRPRSSTRDPGRRARHARGRRLHGARGHARARPGRTPDDGLQRGLARPRLDGRRGQGPHYDISRREALSIGLIGVYDSQVEGGKRSTWIPAGAGPTPATSMARNDEADELWFAMDLTPLVRDAKLDVGRCVLGHIDKFQASVDQEDHCVVTR